MNKKQYIQPDIKVVAFRTSDVIATSYHGPITAPYKSSLDDTDPFGDDDVWF